MILFRRAGLERKESDSVLCNSEMAKIGRNDPCPCGSGKKYKHCCYAKKFELLRPEVSYGDDADWNKIRRTEGVVVHAILDCAVRRYGKAVLLAAKDEFGLWGDFEVDELHLETIFLPWVAFNWIADTDEVGLPERTLPDQPLGLEYLEENADELDEYQQAFIRLACSQPYSFFVVTDSVAGKSLGIRDLFLDRTFTLKEAKASRTLQRGDIVFSRVLLLEDQTIMVGMAPIRLPPSEHLLLLDIRDGLKKRLRKGGKQLNQQLLFDFDLEIRHVYLDAVERLTNPPPLQLQNTDGDPLSFVKLYFELGCSPHDAFNELKSLTLPEFHDDVLEDAIHDGEGNLTGVSFDWMTKGNRRHPEWDNTILGHIEINGERLTAEVNSEKRARKIQSEIKKRLGKRAMFKHALHESVESKLEDTEGQRAGQASEDSRREMEELNSRPEVQALLRKQMEAHWEAWYDEPIPALKNKTPLEAARTKAGRERLEALLCEFDRRNEGFSEDYLRVDVQSMRKKLGLSS
jgi:SEC-C motif-containing protein